MIRNAAPYLSKDFTDANFAYNQALSGQKEQTPTGSMSNLIDGQLGEFARTIICRQIFQPGSEGPHARTREQPAGGFDHRIKNLDWMSAKPKQRAGQTSRLCQEDRLSPINGRPRRTRDQTR